jgi:hypothetical protein
MRPYMDYPVLLGLLLRLLNGDLAWSTRREVLKVQGPKKIYTYEGYACQLCTYEGLHLLVFVSEKFFDVVWLLLCSLDLMKRPHKCFYGIGVCIIRI